MTVLPGANEAPLRGLLVTFEGPEGSGKTTLVRSVAAHLAEHGCEPMVVREPGGTEIGERIRNILLDHASREMCAQTELLLMEASRAQLVREKIVPALAAGLVVLCDRYSDASVAYQGFGRGLGEKVVQRFNEFATGDLEPDLTILCLLPPQEGRERLKHRKQDRLDREDLAFHQRVYEGYLSLAGSGRPRVVTVDARGTPAEMTAAALAHLARLQHGMLKFL